MEEEINKISPHLTPKIPPLHVNDVIELTPSLPYSTPIAFPLSYFEIWQIKGNSFRVSYNELLASFCLISGCIRPTVRLNIFSVRTDGAQGNQVHGFIVQSLEVLNLDFQLIATTSKFYSIQPSIPAL